MSATSVLSQRGFSPAAIVLLLVTAIVGGGVEILPSPAEGCSIAAEDREPEPQPRAESPEESAEDEESGSAKHAAIGSAIVIDWPVACGGTLADRPARLSTDARLDAAPIRGPPSQA
jgi:hypothetical protein